MMDRETQKFVFDSVDLMKKYVDDIASLVIKHNKRNMRFSFVLICVFGLLALVTLADLIFG